MKLQKQLTKVYYAFILSDYDFMLELIADNEYVFQEMYSDTFYNMFKIKMPINIDVAFCKKAYQVNPKTLKFMNNNMKNMVGALSNKLGVDESTITDAMSSGSTEKLLSALSPQDAMKLKSLLSDKAATQKLMQSEQVQKLIKKLSEGK